MDPLPDDIERAVVDALVGRASPDAAALDRICADHPEHAPAIRRRLEAMADIERDLAGTWTVDDDPGAVAAAPAGDRIGPYRLVRVLGEGGMGRVYLAEQERPVRRTVALKVVRPGLASGRIVERFDRERHTLARLTHSGIARIYDAGATDDGLQYFAMEHVAGEELVAHCDARRLDLAARLRLLCRVCEAVQHAHQKGVVHRDLKPGNLLVTEAEGAPRVVVIDFGLARIVESLDDDGARFTEQGTMLGTPEYMSPEQADPLADVDSRSDVYALGVVLYELIVGRLPLDLGEARRQDIRAVQRAIRDREPTPPSRRLLDDVESVELAALRGAGSPVRYARELGPDLDWVTAKALAKDPDDRYQSVGELLDDLERFLTAEPVRAGPPTATYRIRKLVRRHRLAFAAGAGLLVVLLAATGVSVGFWLEASDARDEMEVERDAARREARLSAAIHRVLSEDVLLRASPRHGHRDLLVRDALVDAARRLDERLMDEPLVEASLRQTIGATLVNLGESEAALPQLERARELYEAHAGADAGQVLATDAHLGGALRALGRLDDARALLARSAAEAERTLGGDAALTLRLRGGRALVQADSGDFAAAERELVEVAAIARTSPADSPVRDELPSHLNNLAWLYQQLRRLDDAEELLLEVVERARSQGRPAGPTALLAMSSLGVVYSRQGRRGEAVTQHERVLTKQRELLGDLHRDTLATKNNLALALLADGRAADGERLLRELVDELARGEAPPQRMLAVRNNLAAIHRRRGEWRPAAEQLEDVVAGFEAIGMGAHPNTDSARASLALALDRLGRLDEAARLLEVAAAGRRETLGATDDRVARTMLRLARLHVRRDDLPAALRWYREAVDAADAACDAEASLRDVLTRELALALGKAGEPERARELLRSRLAELRDLAVEPARVARLEEVLRSLREHR